MTRRLIAEHFRVDGRAKHQYATEVEASAAAAVQQTASGSKRRPYHAYRCGFCRLWHIGRKPPPGRRAAAHRGGT